MTPRIRMLPCLLLGALPLVLAACGTYSNQPQADSATIVPGIGVDITTLDNQAVSGMPASLYVSPGEHTLTFRCQDPNDPDTGGAPVYQQVEVELLAQHTYQFAANGLNVTLWDVTNGQNAGLAVLNWDLNDAIADEDQPPPIEGGVYATLGGNFVRPPLGEGHDDRDHSEHPGEPPKNGEKPAPGAPKTGGKPAPSAPSIPHAPRPSGGGGSSHAGSGGGGGGGSRGGGGGSSGGGGGGSRGGGGGGGGGGGNKR